jgi:hypothetical protein
MRSAAVAAAGYRPETGFCGTAGATAVSVNSPDAGFRRPSIAASVCCGLLPMCDQQHRGHARVDGAERADEISNPGVLRGDRRGPRCDVACSRSEGHRKNVAQTFPCAGACRRTRHDDVLDASIVVALER